MRRQPTKPLEFWFAGCKTDELVTFHLVGPEADAVALYEQILRPPRQRDFRYLDRFGDPVVFPRRSIASPRSASPKTSALFPIDHRLFAGFELLREYFVFPRKFLGFRLTGLRRLFAGVKARSLDIVIAFDEVNARLAAAAEPAHVRALCGAGDQSVRKIARPHSGAPQSA